ncbi:hypothetical protein N7468_005021 [Penicillium chermesinum]|uniref:Uncharacterized protein n=1 Tax=Penicillium chermesinum TaxID=63820 RepID=A0A9W9NZ19_9EURO|nr:uncharacterized protein N7468_005021 [Penicillium chermesinum]KAJ5232065.1 hypothetical protein N7468_005021 [Penicillium chermesinum]
MFAGVFTPIRHPSVLDSGGHPGQCPAAFSPALKQLLRTSHLTTKYVRNQAIFWNMRQGALVCAPWNETIGPDCAGVTPEELDDPRNQGASLA